MMIRCAGCNRSVEECYCPVAQASGFKEDRERMASREQIEGEVRVVDPTTGGEKGRKLARFSLIPRDFLWALAEHYGRGARKYDDRNWERGYQWSLSLDALDRHLAQWLMGEDDDPETGSSHLVAVAWHVIALWWWQKRGLGVDDVRAKQATTAPNLIQADRWYTSGNLAGTTTPAKASPRRYTCPQDGEENCCYRERYLDCCEFAKVVPCD